MEPMPLSARTNSTGLTPETDPLVQQARQTVRLFADVHLGALRTVQMCAQELITSTSEIGSTISQTTARLLGAPVDPADAAEFFRALGASWRKLSSDLQFNPLTPVPPDVRSAREQLRGALDLGMRELGEIVTGKVWTLMASAHEVTNTASRRYAHVRQLALDRLGKLSTASLDLTFYREGVTLLREQDAAGDPILHLSYLVGGLTSELATTRAGPEQKDDPFAETRPAKASARNQWKTRQMEKFLSDAAEYAKQELERIPESMMRVRGPALSSQLCALGDFGIELLTKLFSSDEMRQNNHAALDVLRHVRNLGVTSPAAQGLAASLKNHPDPIVQLHARLALIVLLHPERDATRLMREKQMFIALAEGDETRSLYGPYLRSLD